jgi:cell division protein FtsB
MSQLTELDPMLVTPLRRPEPRPRKRRAATSTASNPARPVTTRIAVGLVGAALCVAFAGRIASVALAPVVLTQQTGRDIQNLQQQVAKEAAGNEQLRNEIARLRTPAGVEEEARRRGLVRHGEVALSIVSPEKPDPDDAKVASNGGAGRASVSARIRAAVDTCLAVFGGAPRTR